MARGPGRRAARGSAVLVVQGLRVYVHPLALLPVLPGPVQVGALPHAAVEHSTARLSGLPSGGTAQLQPPPTGRTPSAPAAKPGMAGAPQARPTRGPAPGPGQLRFPERPRREAPGSAAWGAAGQHVGAMSPGPRPGAAADWEQVRRQGTLSEVTPTTTAPADTHSLCSRSSEEPPTGPSSEFCPSSCSLSSMLPPFWDVASPFTEAERSGGQGNKVRGTLRGYCLGPLTLPAENE